MENGIAYKLQEKLLEHATEIVEVQGLVAALDW